MIAHRELITTKPFRFGGLPLENFFGNLESPGVHSHQPHMELSEESDKFVLRAELPGIQEERLNIQVQNDRVTLEILACEEEMSCRFSGFKKSFRFRTSLNAEAAEAELKRGVLTIQLPKTASAVPRRLTINSLP